MKRLLVPLVAACLLQGGSAGAVPPETTAGPTGDDPGLAARLLTALAPTPPTTNTLLSPLGLRFAGALLLPAAQGPTQDELLARFAPGAADGVAALVAFADLRNTLLADHSVTLHLVGGVWTPADTPPSPTYVEQAGIADATVRSLNFGDPAALGAINAWFARQTGGLVPTVLDRLPRDTGLVLGTALYFKGRWAEPFDPAATRPSPFTPAGATTPVDRPTMHQTFAALPYRETPAGQAIRLPFAGGTFEMIVLLPSADPAAASTTTATTATAPTTPAAAALPLPTPAELTAWLEPAGYTPQRVRLALPRARLEGTAELLEPLRSQGLAMALGPAADYGALPVDTDAAPVRLGRIVQKVVLGLDEAGAEAAAATAVVGVRSVTIEPPARRMIVDHPYLLVLRHRPTGALLAMAAVADPG